MLGRQHPALVVSSGVPGPGAAREPLARRVGHELAWIQPSEWRSEWHLVAGGASLVRLEPVSWWRRTLVAELEGERLVFGGSLWHDAAVRERDGVEVARLHRAGWRLDEDSERLGISRWFGVGRVEHGRGLRAWLRREGWAARWSLLDPRGREIATFERTSRPFKVEGSVRLAPLAADVESLTLLVTFAWWVVVREAARRSHAH